MHTTMSNISCLILLSGFITKPAWAQISNMQLLDSVTETNHKNHMQYKNTLGEKSKTSYYLFIRNLG